jgi:hypothetical protein
MATAENLTVAVERAIHDAIAELVQEISIQHGVQVTEFRVDWDDISTYGEKRSFRVSTVYAHTFSKR